MELAGRTCIVTGGAKGIGKAVVAHLHREAAHVAIWDCDLDAARQAAEEVAASTDSPGRLLAHQVDVTRSTDIACALARVRADLGPPYGLVNNAGIYSTSGLLDEDEREWDRVLSVNLTSAFLCIQAVAPGMVANRAGKIVNVSSISGRKESIFASASYCASKAGMIGLTRYVAATLAQYGINVNCVAPAITRTGLIDSLEDAQRQRAAATIPLGYIAEPDDIANTIVFLIKDASRFIAGATIDVNGGSFMS